MSGTLQQNRHARAYAPCAYNCDLHAGEYAKSGGVADLERRRERPRAGGGLRTQPHVDEAGAIRRAGIGIELQ